MNSFSFLLPKYMFFVEFFAGYRIPAKLTFSFQYFYCPCEKLEVILFIVLLYIVYFLISWLLLTFFFFFTSAEKFYYNLLWHDFLYVYPFGVHKLL